ncbi:MAG: hypothetical protein AAGA09_07630 [Pseudomonadota bacterium]
MTVKLIAVALTVSASVIGQASARTFTLSPDPCPASADIAPLEPLAPTEGVDLNRWAGFEAAPVIFDVPVMRVRGGDLFQRFIVDPATGEMGALDPATGAVVPIRKPLCDGDAEAGF